MTLHAPDTILQEVTSDDTYPPETKLLRVRMVPSFFKKLALHFLQNKISAPFFKKVRNYINLKSVATLFTPERRTHNL